MAEKFVQITDSMHTCNFYELVDSVNAVDYGIFAAFFFYFAYYFVWIEDFLGAFVRSFYRLPLDDFHDFSSTETGQEYFLICYICIMQSASQ